MAKVRSKRREIVQLVFTSNSFSTFSEQYKKIYWIEVWIFYKVHDRIPFLLALIRLYVGRFQMPLEGLSFVKHKQA